MSINELITLAEREACRLEQENDHGACIIMRACVEKLREMRDAPTSPVVKGSVQFRDQSDAVLAGVTITHRPHPTPWTVERA